VWVEMAQVLERRAPSGRRVRVSLPADPHVTSVSGHVRFAAPTFLWSFQTGPPGYFALANRELVPASIRARFILQGRELAVAVSDDTETTSVAWFGPYHEVMTVFGGPPPSQDTIVDLFEHFLFDDSPNGLRMTPVSLSGIDLLSETVAVAVLDRGWLTIPAPTQVSSFVPRHRGSPTRHGEVWRAPKTPDGEATSAVTATRVRDYRYILATPGGAGQINFYRTAPVTDQQLLDWMEDIDIAWQV